MVILHFQAHALYEDLHDITVSGFNNDCALQVRQILNDIDVI